MSQLVSRRSRRSLLRVASSMRNGALILLLAWSTQISFGRILGDSVSIEIHFRGAASPVSGVVLDPWQIKRYCDSAAIEQDVSIVLRVQKTTPALPIAEALQCFKNVVGLTLHHNTCQFADSLFRMVRMPRLQGLWMSCSATDSLPNLDGAFPELEELRVYSHFSTFPCQYLRMLPSMKVMVLDSRLSSESCVCEPSRRMIYYGADSLDESIDLNALFIKTGVYTDRTDVHHLYSSPSLPDSVPPRAGTRDCYLEIESQSRPARGKGIPDRFIATLYAQVRSGKSIFVPDTPDLRSGFLRLVEDGRSVLISVRREKLVISSLGYWDGGNEYTYVGPLTVLLRQLIEDGCL